MKLIVTAGELMDRDLWDKACDLLGLTPWAVNEGMLDSSTPIELTEAQARELDLMGPSS
jgi:hypothetical protein